MLCRGGFALALSCLGFGHWQHRQQFGIQRRELFGQCLAQSDIGDLPRARQQRKPLQRLAVGVYDDGRAKGVVAVITGDAEQLSNARFEVEQLLLELLFET